MSNRRPYVKLGGSGVTTQNTGYKNPDVLESVLELPILSDGFQFDNIAAFETPSVWKAAQATKKLVPLFDVYEVADGSTDDTFFETGNFKRRTEKGRDILTFECYLSYCAFAALKSFEQSKYRQLFEFNQDGDYLGVFATDGVKVQGRAIQSITVERRRATKDKVPYVIGEIVFADKDDVLNAVLTESTLTKEDLHGIYDVQLEVVSQSATEVKFKALSGCAGGAEVLSLEENDVIITDSSDATQTTSFQAADANGVYTLTGTGFATGYKLVVDSVIVQESIMYEGIEPVILDI